MSDRLSIAMCTYNGERFLAGQLASFTSQSRLPDELVVCDDGSTDSTVPQLEKFAGSAPFPVRIHCNERNLGVQANFAKAILLCQGDVIFLSDQDDVWLDRKLERVSAVFSHSPDAGLVVTNAHVVDENLFSLGYLHWDSFGFNVRYRRRIAEGHAFQALIQHCPLSGATMAFRSRYASLACPIPMGWTHDWWIARLIAAVAPVVLLDEPLSQYRQHAAQVAGGIKRSLWSFARASPRMDAGQFERELSQYSIMRERLRSPGSPPCSAEVRLLLDEKIALCESRLRMRQRRLSRVAIVLGQLLRGRYHRCARGWVTVGRDLLG